MMDRPDSTVDQADAAARWAGLIPDALVSEHETEEAFRVGLCVPAPMQREAMENVWGVHDDDWLVFRRLCRFLRI